MNELDEKEKVLKIKKRTLSILNEVANLKKYNREIANNISQKDIENYVYETSKNINELQNELETLYFKLTSVAKIINESQNN